MSQPEARLQRKIQEYLRSVGAFCFKVWGNELMMAGLPDIICCYNGRFFGFEVKMPGNKPSPRQVFVIDQIQNAGGVAVVVTSVEEVRKILNS